MQRNRFRAGWGLAGKSWQLVRENKEWIRYPLNSGLVMIGVTIVFTILFALFGNGTTINDDGTRGSSISAIGIVLLFLFYLVAYSVTAYTEVALSRVVIAKLRDEALPEGAGYATANKKLSAIIGYAAISATVGVISQLIRDSARESKNIVLEIVMSILASLIQASWSIVSFFVVPILAVEDIGTLAAVRRSFDLLKKTWGEQLVSNVSLGFLGCGLMLAGTLPGIIIALIGGAISSPLILITGVGALVLGIVIINLLLSAATTVLKTVLYHYALTGETGGLFDTADVRTAFTTKGVKGMA
jgi:hypothetical protein